MIEDSDSQNPPSFAKWFSGKTALITGATSGIGREIAKLLASYGCRVLVCGRDREAMDSLFGELKKNFNVSSEGFIIDLSDKNSQQELITKISKNYEIDILVNNAGFGCLQDFRLMPQDLIFSMQEVNMSAVINLCRAFLPKMVEKSRGGILNVGSVASFFGTPGSALYGATKHFILGFTDALHQEMLSCGVHITGVYPGHTYSRFIERATAGETKTWHKAMSSVLVAKLALKGLSENKIRVIPGWGNKIRVLVASVAPISLILKKIYSGVIKNNRNNKC